MPACPFCHGSIAADARICRGCGLDLPGWVAAEPGRRIAEWNGPPAPGTMAPAPRPAAPGEAPRSQGQRMLHEVKWSNRWGGAGTLWFFAVVNYVIGLWFPDLMGGVGGGSTDQHQIGLLVTAAVYAVLGCGVLAGWAWCMYLALGLYVLDSIYGFAGASGSGDFGRAMRLAMTRSSIAGSLWKVAGELF